MKYCILRAKKLSTFGSIAGSAKHTFREMLVPNADSSRTHLNWTSGAQSSAALCESVKTLLPAKRRKDAVLCIEYLITASPEWFKNSSGKDHLKYFNSAIAWFQKRHGASNIVCVNLQLDESTPHAVIYAVPRTKDGRLSAKDFLGGRAKLVAMQTEFWEQVGKPVGLHRGRLRKKLKDQAERFAKQVEDFGIQLKQAAARYTHLLTVTWRPISTGYTPTASSELPRLLFAPQNSFWVTPT